MPNGDDGSPKNWWRLCYLCQAFKAEYGHWPSYASMGHEAIAEFRHYLPDSNWVEVNQKLPIRLDESEEWRIAVGDDFGKMLKYGDISLDAGNEEAVKWLGQFIHFDE